MPPAALDEMVAVREWRRIPPGGSDLARYQLPSSLRYPSRVVVRLAGLEAGRQCRQAAGGDHRAPCAREVLERPHRGGWDPLDAGQKEHAMVYPSPECGWSQSAMAHAL